MFGQYQTKITRLSLNDDGVRPHRPRFIVIHTFEGNGDISANAMAEYQSGKLPHQRTGSYHVVIDRHGISARENDDEYVPWAAGWNANRQGLHVCVAGRAEYTRAQWLEREPQLRELSRYLTHTSRLHAIPLAKVTGLRDPNVRGVCGHSDVSQAWPTDTNHWDPGGGFPFDRVLEYARGTGNGAAQWHKVQPGDTLSKLAQQYGRTAQQLALWNGLRNPDLIRVGENLRVSPPA